MKRLDRFTLKAFIGPFIGILFIVIFILMMQFLWLYIDELVGKGLGLGVILEFLFWGVCTILPLALPLATLLASMMTLGQMSENNELMAIKSAGVSLNRVLAPLMVAAVVISIAAYKVGDVVVPKAYNKIYTLRDDIGRTKNEINIPAGIFYDGIDGYILRINDKNKETGMMHQVMVYDHTKNDGNCAVTIADSATMMMTRAKDYLIFTMYNGSNYQEDNERKYRDTTLQLQRIYFSKQELIIPLKHYSFEHSEDDRFGDQVKSMSQGQLHHEKDTLAQQVTDFKAKHYKQICCNVELKLRNQLDTSKARGATQPFNYPGFLEWEDRPAHMNACLNASNSAKMMSSTLEELNVQLYEKKFYQRLTDVEILKKIAQALACFIFFFIGAPLGALIGKGGLGTSAIVSVLFFVLYWVIDISGTKLAQDGAVGPAIGVFVSAIILAPIAFYLTFKAAKDAKIFNTESFANWRRKAWSKITGLFHRTRIVYMGTPEFAVAPLDNLIRHKYNVVGVVTVADKPSGRGLKVNESAVKKYAVEHNIPVLQPVKLKDPEFLSQLAAWKADLFVVVAFRMLPEEVWKMPKLGTFNLHAALLPQYRGAAPINWAVINGEKMTGVTTFLIDRNIDTGGIILRQESRISPTDTAGDVHDKLMAIGSDLVLETVEGLIQHNVETRVQRSFIQGSEVLKPAPKLSRELCHIDWNDTTTNIYNLIRGLSPYPTAFTELVREDEEPLQLKIFFGEKMEASAAPGTILSDGKTYMAIATSDGAISLKDIQLSGKKRMDIKSFLLGFREPQTWSTTRGTSKEICQDVLS